MKLYLVRHGEAVSLEVNTQCPLSEKGRNNIQRMAIFLKDMGVFVSQILHSDKLRAVQTAEILAKSIAPGQDLRFFAGLSPNDPIEPMVGEINSWNEDTMLVGHLPFMAKLASQLLMGNTGNVFVDFQPGSIACLERVSPQQWALIWFLNPLILPNSDMFKM